MADAGRILIGFGLVVVAAGLVLLLVGRIPFLGHLPGDIRFQSGGVSCFIPLATSLVVSILLSLFLTIVVNLLQRH